MEKQSLSEDVIKNSIELKTSIHNGKMRGHYDLQKSFSTGKVKLEDFVRDFARLYNQ